MTYKATKQSTADIHGHMFLIFFFLHHVYDVYDKIDGIIN